MFLSTTTIQERSIMADKEKKEEVTLESIQQEVDKLKKEAQSLRDENKSLKDQVTQKDLEITKLTLGGVKKQDVTKVVEDEDVNFDFDF